jgi:GNAT superfamily N-acetyltransferase
MKHITSRIYADEKDLQVILDLSTRVRPPSHLNDYPGKLDIEENLGFANTRANTRLWFDDGQSIAWAYVDEYNNLNWELDDQYAELIGTKIVEWGEFCVRRKLAKGETATLDANCREDYSERISFLDRHGFEPTQGFNVSMTRPLTDPIPEPQLSQGFVIRPIAGIHEAESVAAMHRAAFGTEYMTTENRLVIMGTSGYDPSLDLLAIAPTGEIAAYCSCSVNDQARIGMTDPVATHPKYQRLGLSRALLLTGMRLLKERGMESAHLGTSGDNLAMQRTAESVGFTIEYNTIWFSKEVN